MERPKRCILEEKENWRKIRCAGNSRTKSCKRTVVYEVKRKRVRVLPPLGPRGKKRGVFSSAMKPAEERKEGAKLGARKPGQRKPQSSRRSSTSERGRREVREGRCLNGASTLSWPTLLTMKEPEKENGTRLKPFHRSHRVYYGLWENQFEI